MNKSDLKKEFFINSEVLFVGYSSKMEGFCKAINQSFIRNGIKVFPFNLKDNPNYDVKVHKSLDEIASVPKTAFILFNEDGDIKVIDQLADKGVKRILFQDTRVAKNEVLEECNKKGIETLVACPMMRFGKGLHRFHGFCAGVK